MHNHRFITFIIDLENNKNLYTTQKAITQLSKKFEKDDIFYLSGANDVFEKNKIDSFILNYRYKNNIDEELNSLININKKINGFDKILFILSDNKNSKILTNDKIKNIKKTETKIITISTNSILIDAVVLDSFDKIEEILWQNLQNLIQE